MKYLHICDKGFTYQRDENDLLTSIQTNYDTIQLQYDQNAIITTRKYPNTLEEKITYNANYNIEQIQTADETIQYEYNKIGQVVKKNGNEFVYDHLNRLIQTNTQEFEYDLAGNNLDKNGHYDIYDYRLLENDHYALSYDVRGNLKEKINKHTQEKSLYTFNMSNQLTHFKKYNLNGKILEELSFTYDALNRRISKTHNKQTVHYIYDELNIIAILDDNKKLLATILHDEDIGHLLVSLHMIQRINKQKSIKS
jgi:uncharacterized protein RhaS with RHS repeats